MKVLFFVLSLIIFVHGLLIVASLLYFKDQKLKYLYKSSPVSKKNKEIEFYILLSVFNESKIIESTYKHFKEIVNVKNNIRCVFITTEKEKLVTGRNETKEILEQLIRNDNKFSLINYPYHKGNKPSQLNYALDQLEKDVINKNERDIYICQYDADSRPLKETFEELEEIINITNCNVIQQPTKFDENYNGLNLYLKLEACFQTRWAYGFERRNQMLSVNKYINKIFVPFAYTVGHGMVVKSDFLYNVGKYPSPNEDVPFGQKMILIGEPIYPTVTYDRGTIVETFKDLFYQSGNWIKAPLVSIKMYKEIRHYKKMSIYRSVMFFTKIAFDLLSWVQYIIYLFLCVVVSISEGSINYLIFGFFILWIESSYSVFYTHKYILKENSLKERLLLMIICPIRGLVRGLSLFSFLKQSLTGWYYDSGREITNTGIKKIK
ncbi:hypothetical protein [Robertmurraya kyonggiensis]|uniref:Glycosyltransferase 2-like domain-containing protein n=1 Tax=Robertmurraya kyonggiensis TaxID=1037680 RepID=A0A4V5P439_9BACI|nr:hypothetical protein [Robertmurraya kyonggiensis]TKC19110.1 hypothetical protein FA727_06070 [Robertmurraya kyonggiensis]